MRNFLLMSALAVAASGTIGAQGSSINSISQILTVSSDVARAKSFYVDKLGFKVTKDYEQSGYRWLTIVPPGGGAAIVITNYLEDLKPGGMTIYFSTLDVQAAYKEVTSKGVTPKTDVISQGWGALFGFDDPDGNHLFILKWSGPQSW